MSKPPMTSPTMGAKRRRTTPKGFAHGLRRRRAAQATSAPLSTGYAPRLGSLSAPRIREEIHEATTRRRLRPRARSRRNPRTNARRRRPGSRAPATPAAIHESCRPTSQLHVAARQRRRTRRTIAAMTRTVHSRQIGCEIATRTPSITATQSARRMRRSRSQLPVRVAARLDHRAGCTPCRSTVPRW